jgi:hypothetical protein
MGQWVTLFSWDSDKQRCVTRRVWRSAHELAMANARSNAPPVGFYRPPRPEGPGAKQPRPKPETVPGSSSKR